MTDNMARSDLVLSAPPPTDPDVLAWAREYCRALLPAAAGVGVVLVDSGERLRLIEGDVFEWAGVDAGALTGRELSEAVRADAAEPALAAWRRALDGDAQSLEYTTADRGLILAVQITPLFLGRRVPVAAVGIVKDITDQRRVERDLSLERARRQIVEEMAGVMHFRIDLTTGELTRLEGPALAGGRARRSEGVDGYLARVDPADLPQLLAAIDRVRQGHEEALEYGLRRLDGTPGRVLTRSRLTSSPDGSPILIGASIDVTDFRAAEIARWESETLLQQGFDASPIGMALTDPRTGRYLRVNDALCRLVGRDRASLLGLAMTDISHTEDVPMHLDARRRLLNGERGVVFEKRYIRPDGTEVWASVHLVSVRAPDGTVKANYSQVVDLTAQKEREAVLLQEAHDRERLAELRAALASDRLVLYAQPIIELANGAVVQQELLVRMVDSDNAVVPPADFLPLAERSGLITEIDAWVTARGIELAATGTPVEINLSAASVGDAGTLDHIRAALERTGTDPALVVFEITETALMEDIERGREFAAALRELGCKFALDDLGTGYGTFTYLKHLPIDYLKIATDFVRDLDTSVDDERMVRAIVAMARDFGKLTVAEGVEKAATLARLRELGVDHAQGYHVGRPAPLVMAARER